MNTSLAQQFTDALHQLERTRDLETITAAFAEDATLRRIPQGRLFRGADGARAFWQQYLDQFTEIDTEFVGVLEAGDRVALEWRSTARLASGTRVTYEGVSILEGTGKVERFRTYYDPTALLEPGLRPGGEARPS